MPSAFFTNTEVQELFDALVAAGHIGDSTWNGALESLPILYRTALPPSETPGGLFEALNKLNQTQRLTDGSLPIEVILVNLRTLSPIAQVTNLVARLLAKLQNGLKAAPAHAGEVSTVSPTEAVASVRTGLRALNELLQDPAVRTALAAFRATLDGADRRIQAVGDYKDLHDRLHDLQFKCYEPIASASRLFPGSGVAAQLEFDAYALRGEVEKIRGIVKRPSLADGEFSWVEDELAVCSTLLPAALKNSDVGKLQEVVRRLRDIVEQQPTLINTLLVQAIKFLDLGNLVRRLHEVSGELEKVGADAKQRGEVEKGAGDLAVVDEALRAAVRSHQAWQVADNRLRLSNASRGQSAEELSEAWVGVERALDKVRAADPAAPELLQLAPLVGAAIKDRDESRIGVLMLKFQTIASDRFYQVDKELKGLCDRIAPVGRDLDKLVGQMGAPS